MLNAILMTALLVTPQYANHNRVVGNTQVVTNQAEVVADIESALTDRYTKSEADGRFVQGTKNPDTQEWQINVQYAQEANYASNAGAAYSADSVGWNGVTDHPTTLSGYGITDAKIQNGTIILGEETITPIPNHSNNDYKFYWDGNTLKSAFATIRVDGGISSEGGITHAGHSVVYGISTNGTDYLHADVNLAPFGDGILSQARADSETIATNTFAANADYQLTNATTTAFALASGQIGNYETTANITLTLDFSAAADRSGDCLLWLANTDAANEHTITILPNTLEVHGFEDGYLSAPKASTNLFMFSRVKANTIVVSKREVK